VSGQFIALVIAKETAAWAGRRARRLRSMIRAFLDCSPDSPRVKHPPLPRDFD
jgi:hypothetical protein